MVVVAVNLVGNKLVARSEVIVVSVELVILVVFAAIAGVKADPARFTHNADHSFMGVLFAAGLLYVTYEGFGVVTNSAGDMRDPARELPRAMFTALGIVVAVYVVVSTLVVMTMTLPAMDAAQVTSCPKRRGRCSVEPGSSSSDWPRCWPPPPV